MVLTKAELISALQNEVRILLHLCTKVEPAHVDYRPTPKQRSTLELLRYLSFMGPHIVTAVKTGTFDMEAWGAAEKAAAEKNFETVVADIGKLPDSYASSVGSIADADLRQEIEMFGQKGSRGQNLVYLILCAHAAYRTQIFLYLKSAGREELNTYNLWAGMDGKM